MKVKIPKEDPTIKSAREAEQRRAEAAYVENTGELLDEKTRKRIRRFGSRGGAVSASVAAVGGGSGATGGGSFDPAGGSRPLASSVNPGSSRGSLV